MFLRELKINRAFATCLLPRLSFWIFHLFWMNFEFLNAWWNDKKNEWKKMKKMKKRRKEKNEALGWKPKKGSLEQKRKFLKHYRECQKLKCSIEGILKTVAITVSRSTWMTTKINGVVTNLIYMGVIGHPWCIFLN